MADLFIGLMSGTSMDGIDAALVDFTASRPDVISTHSHKYPAALHRQLEAALELEAPLLTDLSAIDAAVGETFAAAANELLSKTGVLPDWVEAAAFAWLAKQQLANMPGNIPAVTGATRAVLLGQLFKF